MKVKDVISKDRLLDLFYSQSIVIDYKSKKTGIFSDNFEKLIDKILNEQPEDEFMGGQIKCDLCGHDWVGVFYKESDKLECPNCGRMVNYTIS